MIIETLDEELCILVSTIKLRKNVKYGVHIVFVFFLQERNPPISKLRAALFHDAVIPVYIMKTTSSNHLTFRVITSVIVTAEFPAQIG